MTMATSTDKTVVDKTPFISEVTAAMREFMAAWKTAASDVLQHYLAAKFNIDTSYAFSLMNGAQVDAYLQQVMGDECTQMLNMVTQTQLKHLQNQLGVIFLQYGYTPLDEARVAKLPSFMPAADFSTTECFTGGGTWGSVRIGASLGALAGSAFLGVGSLPGLITGAMVGFALGQTANGMVDAEFVFRRVKQHMTKSCNELYLELTRHELQLVEFVVKQIDAD